MPNSVHKTERRLPPDTSADCDCVWRCRCRCRWRWPSDILLAAKSKTATFLLFRGMKAAAGPHMDNWQQLIPLTEREFNYWIDVLFDDVQESRWAGRRWNLKSAKLQSMERGETNQAEEAIKKMLQIQKRQRKSADKFLPFQQSLSGWTQMQMQELKLFSWIWHKKGEKDTIKKDKAVSRRRHRKRKQQKATAFWWAVDKDECEPGGVQWWSTGLPYTTEIRACWLKSFR